MNFKITKLNPFGLLIEPVNGKEDIRDLDTDELKDILSNEHIISLRGFKSFDSAEDFSEYCEKFGEISLWPFGKVLELVEHDNPKDHVYDNTYMPLHWDGMYRKQIPEIQVFHCVSAPGISNGGGTTFTNTKMVLERIPKNVREYWDKVTCIYSRKMEYYDSKTIAPIINKHPEKDFSVIRYCETPSQDDGFINHPSFELKGIPKQEAGDFIKNLNNALYSPENLYTHQWKTGDIVFTDNYTLLHGREPFTKGAPRHLRRVHILGKTPLDNPHLIYTK
ncbi:pyoverdine biosynthesis protein PvcB [Flavivirga aquatica]|uniref:Pyoverdine biosynthesis protein PvcB n=1 Tax=Flavivirga aquatica TaxID=1849968 RepID=A0A1E5TA95_9FLAO|nr:TauD/TfdA family dioxygenase [Flavivirga aquatica]OEK08281.1 pyoverdine biosynthesis protein PvcB [Flavivirga aquatica]